MNKPNEKAGFYSALLFLIWPLLAVASAFRNYKSSWAKNILWAFCAFYGFSFAIGAESEGSDINFYLDQYQNLHQAEMSFGDAVNYYQNSGEIDVLKTIIAVVLSRITDSQSMLTLVYGIIFGFFFSRNMFYILEQMEGKIKPVAILLFVCFFLVIPIWKMNGFRMWTAAHIFIYGLLPFLIEGKTKGVFISMLAVLVHFSFVIPVGVLIGYILMGNRLVFYFGFFIITFFVSEINIEAFNRLIENYAPEIVQERTSSYRGDRVELYREGELQTSTVWYAAWYGRALNWSVMGFITVLFFAGRSFFYENKGWLNLFSFTLLFYGVANLLTSIPSGGRFINIANMISLALIIIYVQNREHDRFMKRFVWAVTPALLLYIVVAFRIGLYSMSATAIMGNPVISFFLAGEHISMNDIMRMLL